MAVLFDKDGNAQQVTVTCEAGHVDDVRFEAGKGTCGFCGKAIVKVERYKIEVPTKKEK